jgi:hypothetical protein
MTRRARILSWSVVVCALVAFLYTSSRFCAKATYFLDDPYISMRYAANLAEHGELSFNPGERVEGYSNFLHVLLEAAVFRTSGIPNAVVAEDEGTYLVFAAAVLQLVVLGKLARRAAGHEAESAAWYYAWILTAASWPFAFWATAGLETPIEGLLYAGIVAATTAMGRGARARTAWVLVAGLLVGVTLLRFEGVLVAFAATGAIGWHLWTTGRRREAGSLAAAVVVPSGAYHLWRLVYFGHLLPNTFVAKATGGSAWHRLASGASYGGQWLAFTCGAVGMVALGIGATLSRERLRFSLAKVAEDPVALVAAAIVVAKVLLVVWGGGDWMPGWRMLVPVSPLALFLVFRALFAALDLRVDLRANGLPALALGLALLLCSRPSEAYFADHNGIPDETGLLKKVPRGYVSMGDTLERVFKPASLREPGSDNPLASSRGMFGGGAGEVAIGEAGLIPFEARHVRFMDLMGLVDEDMARQPGAMHEKVHASHVVERAPVAVVFAHLNFRPPYGPYQYGAELLGSAAFHAAYRRVELDDDITLLGWALYVRRDIDAPGLGLVWSRSDPFALLGH